MKRSRSVMIIGGGAAGMTAAVLLSEAGFDVTLLERQDRIGKKILQTGNGRCNISNTKIHPNCYVSDTPLVVKNLLSRFSKEKERAFLSHLGIELCERDGCLYPVSRQASSVLDAYRYKLRECKVRIITDVTAEKIRVKENGFEVCGNTADGSVGYGDFGYVLLACGGSAGVYREAEHNGYGITKEMGHGLTKIHPALVPLKCEGEYKAVSGVRADALCRLCIGDKKTAESKGEVQFTDSGLSGIPVFQLSLYLNDLKAKKPVIELDLLSFLGEEEAAYARFAERAAGYKERTVEEFFAGWLQKKLAIFLIKESGLKASTLMRDVSKEALKQLYETARHYRTRVLCGGDWRSAQIQCGGIPLNEVSDSLESVKIPGVYLAGEMLDVAGMCGGYNLHFALCSAHICADAIIKDNEATRK